jgi:hypothetical protein
MIGISAGVHDMINMISSPPGERVFISSGKNAQDVVEVLSGFVESAHGGHIPVSLPLQRATTTVTAQAETMVARI